MRLPIAAAVSAAILLTACSQSGNVTPKTDDEKALYSMGVITSERVGLQSLGLTDQEMAFVKSGFHEGSQDKSQIKREDIEALMPKIQEFVTKKAEAMSAKAKEEGVAFLAKAEKEQGAIKLPSGVIVKVTQEGTGAQPVVADKVKVNYEGKLTNGTVFDSSEKHGGPAEFPLGGVVPCWGDGFQQLKVGAKAQITCPSDTAYGEQGSPPTIPGNSVLVFNVELLEILKADEAAPAPANPH